MLQDSDSSKSWNADGFSIRKSILEFTRDVEPIQFGAAHRQNIADAQRSYIKKEQMSSQFKRTRETNPDPDPDPNPNPNQTQEEMYASTLNEDEKRRQKKTLQEYNKRVRSDKKRHKRSQVDESESWTNQAMQIIHPPSRVEDGFLNRSHPQKTDIGFIGDVSSTEILKDEEGFCISASASASASTSASTSHFRNQDEIQSNLPLALQKYYVSNEHFPVVDPTPRKDISVPPPLPQPQSESGNGNHELQPVASTHRSVCERHLQAMSNKGGQYSFVINLLMHERQCNVPIDMLPEVDAFLADIKDISRAEEERFLRQPIPEKFERECVEGKNCEGYYVNHAYVRFALVEYQPPEIREEFQYSKKWPEKQGMCIMCRRKYANFVFYNILSRCTSYDYSSVEQAASTRNMSEGNQPTKPLMISSFANFVGQGEYSPWNIQISGITQYVPLFKPIVLHHRYMYRQEKRDGIWYFIQNYPKPQRNLRFGDGQVYEEDSSSTEHESAKRSS